MTAPKPCPLITGPEDIYRGFLLYIRKHGWAAFRQRLIDQLFTKSRFFEFLSKRESDGAEGES